MSQENVEIVRSVIAIWERGDYSSADWAHPDIEFVIADGPAPGHWTGVRGMAEGWRDVLSAWDGFHAHRRRVTGNSMAAASCSSTSSRDAAGRAVWTSAK